MTNGKLFGVLKASITIREDIVAPIDESWNVEEIEIAFKKNEKPMKVI